MTDFDLIIEPKSTSKNYWKDLYRFRELFYVLAWRDLSVRYKQTVLGITWSVLRPLITMIVFTVIFNKVAKLPSEGNTPYAVMVFAGLLPWYFFSNALTESSGSLIGNSNLISKVYFPRMIIPASSVIVTFADFLISFVLMIALMVLYSYTPSINMIYLPLFIMLTFLASIGPGLLLTALNVKYRDFKYVIPFIVQFGLYVSPVGFSSSAIPEEYRLLYSLNPVVGIIDGFRWCILGEESNIYLPGFILSLGIIFLLLIAGVRYFRKTEKLFADVI